MAPQEVLADYLSIRQTRAACYSFAIVCAALGLWLRLALNSVLGITVPYITFFPAIMLSAWAGGFGPGLLTTLLGAVAAQYFLLAPLYSFALPSLVDSLSLGLFVAVGTIISVLNQSLRTARAESLEHVKQLTSAMAERLRTEQALKASRERLQLALNGTLADGGTPMEDISAAYPKANWDEVCGQLFLQG